MSSFMFMAAPWLAKEDCESCERIVPTSTYWSLLRNSDMATNLQKAEFNLR